MPESSVFRWIDGNGWIVYSGGPDDDVRATAINRSAADGGIAVIALGGDDEAVLFDLQDLGIPAGYLVDPVADNDAVVLEKLSGASVVLITGARTAREARAALTGAPLEGMQVAYDQGAVILVEGAAITLFGGWSVEGELRDGLDWLESAALLTDAMDDALARDLLLSTPEAIALTIGQGSAIAFAADGTVETWGQRQIVVRLGSQYAK
jgi:hypothetical protein